MDLKGEVNLAVAYDGIVELDDPGFALSDLDLRVDELGVVGNVKPYTVNDLGRRHDVNVDFYGVPPGKKTAWRAVSPTTLTTTRVTSSSERDGVTRSSPRSSAGSTTTSTRSPRKKAGNERRSARPRTRSLRYR